MALKLSVAGAVAWVLAEACTELLAISKAVLPDTWVMSATDCASMCSWGAGNSSQDNCSCKVYALLRSTGNQWSIDPVGQGGTQAMQWLHLSASTT